MTKLEIVLMELFVFYKLLSNNFLIFAFHTCWFCGDVMHLIGVVVALHGKETGAGDFMVLDVLEAGLAPQIEPQLKSSMIWVIFLASIFVIFFLPGSDIYISFYLLLINVPIHYVLLKMYSSALSSICFGSNKSFIELKDKF